MRFLFVALVLGAGLLAWAWAGAAGPPPAAWRADRPRPASGGSAVFRSVEGAVTPVVGELGPEDRERLRAVVARALTLTAAVPVFALLVSSAVFAGLFVRESARTALRFSSPTWSYVGKRLGSVALVLSLVLPVLPEPVPAWACYAAVLLLAFGVALYVANLPTKL